MSGRNSEAFKNEPVKPINYYLEFRAKKLVEYKDEPKKIQKTNKDWREMDEKVKEKLKADFDSRYAQYLKDHDEWRKKYNIKDDEVKTKPSKEKKVEKARGSSANKSASKNKKDNKEAKSKD